MSTVTHLPVPRQDPTPTGTDEQQPEVLFQDLVSVPAESVWWHGVALSQPASLAFAWEGSDASLVEAGILLHEELESYLAGGQVTTWAYQAGSSTVRGEAWLQPGEYAVVVFCADVAEACEGAVAVAAG